MVGGIGGGLLFRGNSTVAGTGIISRVLQLKTGMPITQIYVLIDGAVVLILGLTFGWNAALYALIMLFVWGLATDYVLEGPSVVRTVFIVTDAPESVSQAVVSKLGFGVTAWQGPGMFTGAKHTILFSTVSRPDVGSLKSAVAEVDPNAFIVIGTGHQASGGVIPKGVNLRNDP